MHFSSQHLYNCQIMEATSDEATISCDYAITAPSHLPHVAFTVLWKVLATGDIIADVKAKVRPSLYGLPRFGLELLLREGIEELEYYGYGPTSSYIDMHHHCKKALHKSTVSEQYTNYIFPQETGNHFGTKWVQLGRSIKIESISNSLSKSDEFEFSALHYSSHDLDKAPLDKDLVKRPETFVHIDCKQTGIGSHSCGPELHSKYRFNEKEFEYSFRISPVL